MDESAASAHHLKQATQENVYAEDDALKAHAYCVSKKIGFQNEKGEIQRKWIKDKLYGQMERKAANALIKKCVIDKGDPIETAFASLTCFHSQLPHGVTIFS